MTCKHFSEEITCSACRVTRSIRYTSIPAPPYRLTVDRTTGVVFVDGVWWFRVETPKCIQWTERVPEGMIEEKYITHVIEAIYAPDDDKPF